MNTPQTALTPVEMPVEIPGEMPAEDSAPRTTATTTLVRAEPGLAAPPTDDLHPQMRAIVKEAALRTGLEVPDYGLLLSNLAATMAVWGIQQMLMRNVQLVAATEENQRLAV